MKFSAWYKEHFESRLSGRYIHSKHIAPLLDLYGDEFSISVIGSSEKGQNIHCIKLGTGKKVVLAWSQMHGNESTTTKAVFDFFKFIAQNSSFELQIEGFLNTFTFYCIPILNPDGAEEYSRENANNIDLNRDARELSQAESRILRKFFNKIKPDLCLNLHDQRTVYSLPNKMPATVSFLAPAANKALDITNAREIAMKEIASMYSVLNELIPGQIGRYDDSFNDSCVGDSFQMEGVPTLLFEAGHSQGDYKREKSREYIFYALLTLFGFVKVERPKNGVEGYFLIPENEEKCKDVIIRNVILPNTDVLTSLAIQYEEVLENDQIRLAPILDEIGDLNGFFGHKEVDAQGVKILMNSHENLSVGEKVSIIVSKNAINRVFFRDSLTFI
jgi:zinc carboxypeptidase